MKTNLFVIGCVLSLMSCGSDTFVERSGPPGPKGDTGAQGPKGDPGPTASTSPSLEGYYTLPGGGYVDIYKDAQGLYTVRAARITVVNHSGSIGVLPMSSTNPTPEVNGVVYNTTNQTYATVTHNVFSLALNGALNGPYLTQTQLSLDGKKRLVVKVIVTSNSMLVFTGSTTSN